MPRYFRLSIRPILLVLPLFLSLTGCFQPVRLTEAPEGEVPEVGNLYFEFDTPIVSEDSLNRRTTEQLVRFDPPINGAFQWFSPTRLKFSPSDRLQPCRDYTAVLQPAVLMGLKQPTDFDTIRFHTPYFEAKSVSFSWSDYDPYEFDAGVEMKIQFTKEVEPREALKFIEVRNDGKLMEQMTLARYSSGAVMEVYIDGADLKSPGKPIEVRLKKELPSEIPHAQLTEDIVLQAELSPAVDLDIRTVKSRTEGGKLIIVLDANQKIDPDALRPYLTVTPESAIGLQSRGSEIWIMGDFKPGSLVNITVRKGATGKRGGTLWKDFSYNLTLPPLKPFMRFADNQGKYLLRNGAENVNVKCVNMPEFEARVYEVYENNLLHFLNHNRNHFRSWDYYSDETDYFYGYGHDLSMRDYGNLLATDTIKTDETRKNEVLDIPLNLQKHLRSRFRGIFAMELSQPGDYWSQDSKIISLSDLGLIAKKSDDELLVFVNALSTARPVAGATVKIISTTNQAILSASTDGNGVARFSNLRSKLSAAPGGWEPRLIVASYGEDFNFLDLKHSEVDDGRWEMEGRRRRSKDVFLFSERNLYRPGDTAHFAAIVRDEDLRPHAEIPLLFRVYGPAGDQVVDKKKMTDAQGGLEIEIPMGAGDRTGQYNAEVLDIDENVLQSYSFNLEEFVPDKIKVGVSALQQRGRPGDSLLFPLSAAYYFGSNCSEHVYEYRIRFARQHFFSRKFPNFRFSDDSDRGSEPDMVEGAGKLNRQGLDTLLFKVPDKLEAAGPVTATLTATVYDNTAHTVYSRTRFNLITQEHYLGLRSAGSYYSVNDNFEMEVVAVDNDDKVTPGFPIVIEVQRLDWKQAMRKRVSGYSYVSESEAITIQRDTITQGSKPYRFQMRLREAGNYTVRVRSTEAGILSNSVSFSAYGKEVATASSFGVDREGAITVTTDKSNYKSGETARLLFTAPFSGRMLVTVERDKVYDYRYLTVENNSAELVLPLGNSAVPNVVVSATLFRPQRTMGALPMTVAHGYAALKVDNPNLRLPLRIEAPERMKPGERATIAVRTTPMRDVRVTVAIVDEGILAIKQYQTPDPYAFMYAARKASVESYDMYRELLPEVPSAQGATGGGEGGGSGLGLLNPVQARRYKPVAVWSGILRTDAAGRVRTSLQIPKEFNGKARIMAVAWHNDRFGSGDAPITIKDDVVMMPGVPRFATAGDTLIIPVNLLNTTQKSGTATVQLSATGPLKVLGQGSQEMKLGPEGSVTGSFRVLAKNAIGVAGLKFRLSGMETAEHDLELAVRPPSPLETESGSGSILPGESKTIAIPAGYYPGLHRTSFRISNLPALAFADHLEYLLRYPHGCVEQTTSAVFPQLYFGELAELIAPDLYQSSNAVHHVREGIRKLESMQLYDGGFSYWPGGGYGSRWASVYVTHFLLEARKAGFSVNEATIDNALGHLRSFASDKATFTYVYYRDTRRYQAQQAEKESIYALYVLALAGKADVPLLNYYKNHPELLSGDTRYLLASAFALSGDIGSFEALMPDTWEPEQSERLSGGSFDSPVRANAVMLNALVDADPEHPFVDMLIRYLSEHRGDIHSTQDRAWTFLALGKAIRNNAGAPLEIEVLVDGKPQMSYTGGQMNLGDLDLMGKTITLKAKPAQKGKSWYSWRIDGIRSGGGVKTKDRDNGLRIRRKYFSPEGREYLAPVFKQGEIVVCRLELSATRDAKNVAIVDLIPAGFEIENPRLTGSTHSWIKGVSRGDHVDARDDRAIYYTAIDAGKRLTFSYLCRVVNQGTFLLPPLGAEAMYDPGLHSFVSGDTVRVYDAETELPDQRFGPLPAPESGEPGKAESSSGNGLWTQIRSKIGS